MLTEAKAIAARRLLWIGAFMSIIGSVAKTAEDVTTGIGALDVVRGIGPGVFFAIALFVAPHSQRRSKLVFTSAALAVFLVVALFSSLWSVHFTTTTLKAVQLVFTYACVMRIGVMYESPRAAIRGVITAAHFVMLASLMQLAIWPKLVYVTADNEAVPRLWSRVPDVSPNLLGVVALIAIVGLMLKVGPKWTSHAPVTLILIGVYFAELLATRSRTITALAGLLIAVAALSAMRQSRSAARTGWILIPVAVASAWVALQGESTLNQLNQFVLRGQNAEGVATLTGRTIIWDRALEAWSTNPLLGFGYYAGHRLGLPRIDPIFLSYSNLDSTWIETLVDLGLLGLVPLALFSVAALVSVLRLRCEPAEKVLAILIVAAVLSVSFINPGIQTPSISLILFGVIVFGCSESHSNRGLVSGPVASHAVSNA